MTNSGPRDKEISAVGLWLDPVCPFSWHTARWLIAASVRIGFDIDWRIISLAVLNEGRELPEPQRARMKDSRRAGRLMAALHAELGNDVVGKAYVSFAEQYHDHSAALDDLLAEHVIRAVDAERVTAAAVNDSSWDATVSRFHRASQDALGESGGSPMLTIGGRTAFGPVFSAVPTAEETRPLFDAVSALLRAPEFSQLQLPRLHG